MKSIASWLGRRFILFLLLALAIAIFQSGVLAWAWHSVDGGDEWANAADVAARMDQSATDARGAMDANLAAFPGWTAQRRADALARRRERMIELNAALADAPGWLDRYRPDQIVGRQKLTLERAAIGAEIAVLEGHVDLDEAIKAAATVAPGAKSVQDAASACDAANRAIREFNALPYGERWTRNRVGGNDAAILSGNARRHCARASDVRRDHLAAQEMARERIAAAQQQLAAQRAAAGNALDAIRSPQVGNTFADIVTKAALALLAIMIAPYLIRMVLYCIVAPLAQRRAAIRIPAMSGARSGAGAGEGEGRAIPTGAPSAVSLSVRLAEGEELLVRQGFLQTTSAQGDKATRWLLDYRHPLSSIASGLFFLTRIRGERESATISATRDGFSEVATIVLPAGAACVLHPRALAAVVQPVGRPIAIRSHWRLFSLNAWLTLQLRFFVFHGAGRLIVKGGRGIRIERAERGRIFAQDQLVGFSADLAYSVTRAETLAPYLFGTEPLLKDRVEAGNGILVIEEAPLSLRSGKMRRGLEGMADAALKTFGL